MSIRLVTGLLTTFFADAGDLPVPPKTWIACMITTEKTWDSLQWTGTNGKHSDKNEQQTNRPETSGSAA